MREKRRQAQSQQISRRQSQSQCQVLKSENFIEQKKPRKISDGMIIERPTNDQDQPIVTDMFLDRKDDQLQTMLDEDLNTTFVSKRKGSTQFFFKAEKIEERLIRDTLGVLKGVFDCEEQHSFNSHQDYFRLFEIAVGILENYRHDEETLRFSPAFMSGFLEILRTDTNHEFISGKAIMAIANDLITTRYKYH
jgi:HD-GYP domain-containing protein (c-di-GMP phosphodiesterase class II)